MQLRKEGLSYELTRALVAMARQTSGLKELMEVLGVADVVVQTCCNVKEALAKAEFRGWMCADSEMSMLGEIPLQVEEASLPQEAVVLGSRVSSYRRGDVKGYEEAHFEPVSGFQGCATRQQVGRGCATTVSSFNVHARGA